MEYYPGEILTERQARINHKIFFLLSTYISEVLSPNVLVMLSPSTIINRIQFTTLDGMDSQIKHISYIAPVISNRPNNILLTKEQVDKFSQISSEFRNGLINMEEAIIIFEYTKEKIL